jgi:sec-independent protein translocase protein TatC
MLGQKIFFKQNCFQVDKQQKFNFKLNLPFSQHFEEFRQRSFHLITLLFLFSLLAFFEIKLIVKLLEVPLENLKFFQLAPDEYFIQTVKIAFYTGLIFISPILLSQITFFLLPGLTIGEKKIILPLLVSSIILFFLSLGFSYLYIIPAALTFFINYNSDVIEPLWYFSQYCDFIIVLFLVTSITFQIPIFQIILGILGVFSGKIMLQLLKYIILIAVIIGAILTPSTDPVTQIFLSSAIIILYFLGACVLIFLKR